MKHSMKGRLKELRSHLTGRTGQREFKENCEALSTEIDRLETIIAA